MSDLSPVGKDLLVLHIETTDPVKWHLRAAMQFSDIPTILRGVLKPSVLFLVIRTMFYLKKNAREPKDF